MGVSQKGEPYRKDLGALVETPLPLYNPYRSNLTIATKNRGDVDSGGVLSRASIRILLRSPM